MQYYMVGFGICLRHLGLQGRVEDSINFQLKWSQSGMLSGCMEFLTIALRIAPTAGKNMPTFHVTFSSLIFGYQMVNGSPGAIGVVDLSKMHITLAPIAGSLLLEPQSKLQPCFSFPQFSPWTVCHSTTSIFICYMSIIAKRVDLGNKWLKI